MYMHNRRNRYFWICVEVRRQIWLYILTAYLSQIILYLISAWYHWRDWWPALRRRPQGKPQDAAYSTMQPQAQRGVRLIRVGSYHRYEASWRQFICILHASFSLLLLFLYSLCHIEIFSLLPSTLHLVKRYLCWNCRCRIVNEYSIMSCKFFLLY